MNELTSIPVALPDLLTLTGLTGFLYMVVAAVNSAQLLPSRRYLPLLSMAVGSLIAAGAALATGFPVGDALVLGAVSGSLSSGVEETRKGIAEATHTVRDRLNDARLRRQIEDEFGDEAEDLPFV